MKPKKPQKPLTNMQVWGLDDEDMPDMDQTDDELLEELLADDYGDNTIELCARCGLPIDLCECLNED